jgi:hypothetical protein
MKKAPQGAFIIENFGLKPGFCRGSFPGGFSRLELNSTIGYFCTGFSG